MILQCHGRDLAAKRASANERRKKERKGWLIRKTGCNRQLQTGLVAAGVPFSWWGESSTRALHVVHVIVVHDAVTASLLHGFQRVVLNLPRFRGMLAAVGGFENTLLR